jgi:hypothetical protein
MYKVALVNGSWKYTDFPDHYIDSDGDREFLDQYKKQELIEMIVAKRDEKDTKTHILYTFFFIGFAYTVGYFIMMTGLIFS